MVKVAPKTKNVLANIGGTFIVKGFSIVVGFLAMPAYLHFFHSEAVLGAWLTILSVLTWILFFDLGVGNGLRNTLVAPLLGGDNEEVRRQISSAYIFVAALALLLLVVLFPLCFVIDWNSILNISSNDLAPSVLSESMFVVFSGVVVQFCLRLITSICYAMQKSFVPNLLTLITNVAVLVFLTAAPCFGWQNNMLLLSVFYAVAVNAPLLVATLTVFGFPLRGVRPSFRYYSRRCAKKIVGLGLKFLFLQLAALFLGVTVVTYLIAFLVGSQSVVEFSLYNKIFSQFYTLLSLVMIPIWSAFTQAKEERDFAWMNKVLSNIFKVTLLLSLGQLVIAPALQPFFDLWVGKGVVHVDRETVLVFMLNTSVMMAYTAISYISNGIEDLKSQIVLMSFGAAVLIPLAVLLTKMMADFDAVLIAQACALIPYCVIQGARLNKLMRMS